MGGTNHMSARGTYARVGRRGSSSRRSGCGECVTCPPPKEGVAGRGCAPLGIDTTSPARRERAWQHPCPRTPRRDHRDDWGRTMDDEWTQHLPNVCGPVGVERFELSLKRILSHAASACWATHPRARRRPNPGKTTGHGTPPDGIEPPSQRLKGARSATELEKQTRGAAPI